MFQKYNLVCRAAIKEAPDFIKQQYKDSCKGNMYTTTLHTLNSLIVKCSKLTKAVRVYRGTSRGVLPQSFWDENEHGVRGGVEFVSAKGTWDLPKVVHLCSLTEMKRSVLRP